MGGAGARTAGGETQPEPHTLPTRASCTAYESFYTQTVRALDGAVVIRAHEHVSTDALAVARDRVGRVLGGCASSVRSNLRAAGAELRVVGKDSPLTTLPEFRHLRGVKGGLTPHEGDATLDERSRGQGGLFLVCGEENLLDCASDPRYAGRDILAHELAHCLFEYGLDDALRARIRAQFARSVEVERRWDRKKESDSSPQKAPSERAYAGTNVDEYFAESTMWYFGTHGDFIDAQARHPPPGAGGLATVDPEMLALLGQIYGGILAPELVVVSQFPNEALHVTPEAALAADAHRDGRESCKLLIHNATGAAVDVFWAHRQALDRGPVIEKLYGSVAPGGVHAQSTYAGHVWVVRRPPGDGDGAVPSAEAPAVCVIAAREGLWKAIILAHRNGEG